MPGLSGGGAPAVAVVGGGPAGLMAAEAVSQAGLPVTVYERMPSVGRKLLMAGRGGLNLTHSEPLPRFLRRYGEAEAHLAPLIEAFGPEALRAWAQGLGEATFVGTSGRVFPTALKASPLLRAWLRRLEGQGVRFRTRRAWAGWDEAARLRLQAPDGTVELVEARATVLALGGASWPWLGSDGGWVPLLAGQGIEVGPLRAANVGFEVAWTPHLRDRFAGEPLKRISVTAAGRTVRGELVVTRYGLEGGALYALSAPLRDAIAAHGHAAITIDLRPDLTAAELERRLAQGPKGQSLANSLRKAVGLSPAASGVLRDAAGAALPRGPAGLARLVKAVPLTLTGMQGLERAISTAGGVRLAEVDAGLMLRRLPGVFVAGEMLDWEAPTGGYLLQACFASGKAAGEGALRWLARHGG